MHHVAATSRIRTVAFECRRWIVRVGHRSRRRLARIRHTRRRHRVTTGAGWRRVGDRVARS